jgi:hypothetical protein
MLNLTADSKFIIACSGEHLRGLVSLKIKRIDVALEREEALYTQAVIAEKAQADAEAQLRGIHQDFRNVHAAQLGGTHLIGGMVRPDSEQNIRNMRALRVAKDEIMWLHDRIIPSESYQLNRGDLAMFGGFSIPGEDGAALGINGLGQCLA